MRHRFLILALLALLTALSPSSLEAVNKFVCGPTDTGAGCTDGECWENSYTTMARDWGVETSFTFGTDVVYVCDEHAESTAASISIIGSTVTAPEAAVPIICVAGNATGTTPGVLCTADHAEVTVTGVSSNISIQEHLFFHGVDFFGSNNANIGTTVASHDLFFQSGRFELTGAQGSDTFTFGASSSSAQLLVEFRNFNFDWSAAGQGFDVASGIIRWRGGTLEADLTTLFETVNGRRAEIFIEDVDLSILTGGIVSGGSNYNNGASLLITRSVLNAATSLVSGTITSAGTKAEAYYALSGTAASPALQMQLVDRLGSVSVDTTRTMTGGASDGTTAYSWSLDTTSGVAGIYSPRLSPPVSFFLAGDGATPHTIRFQFANTAMLTNQQAWITCETQTAAATSSLGDITTSWGGPGQTPANLTASGASWSCASDCGTAVYTEVTVTPDKSGFARCWASMALASDRISFNPKPEIDP